MIRKIWQGKCEECGTTIHNMLIDVNFFICPNCGLAQYDSDILEGEEYEYYKQEGMLDEY